MVNYSAGDFVIRVKNASLAGKKELSLPLTRFVYELAQALKREGFLSEVRKDKGILSIKLSFKDKRPVILDMKVVSAPGKRVYQTIGEIKKRKGSGILILSTSKGVLSSKEVLKKGIGGEVVAEVW